MNTQLGTPHHNPGYVRWLTNVSVNANFNFVQRYWRCPCPCYMFCVFRQESGNLWCETSKEFAWASNTIKKTILERRSTSDILLRSFLSSLLYLSRLSSIQKTSTLKNELLSIFGRSHVCSCNSCDMNWLQSDLCKLTVQSDRARSCYYKSSAFRETRCAVVYNL